MPSKLRSLQARRRLGFTLIELMMVVAILGVLAALAIPAFTGYLLQTKTSEATTNLNNIFKSAAAFYTQERSEQGVTGQISQNCIVGTVAQSPSGPNSQKQRFTANSGFQALGFTISDYVYYGYGVDSIAAANTIQCGIPGGSTSVYTFYAHGDIDGDSLNSTFSMAAGTTPDMQLYHARGIYAFKPIE